MPAPRAILSDLERPLERLIDMATPGEHLVEMLELSSWTYEAPNAIFTALHVMIT
jgi:hypothetical protein